MDHTLLGILGFVLIFPLLALGIHIGIVFALAGMIGLTVLSGWPAAYTALTLKSYDMTANYILTAIPMFILMGYFVFAAGIAQELFATARKWFSWLPGALAISTVMACAALGACCGSSLAAAATMSKIAIPVMREYGYDRRLALGAVASAGPLASLIPPSILMVVYGVMTQTSVGKVLIGGIIPGIMSAIIYSTMIVVRTSLNPKLGATVPGITWRERLISLRGVLGVLVLFLLIMGGMYTGWFTPTEAGGIGALGALLIALVKRTKFSQLKTAAIESIRSAASIYLIIIGVNVYVVFLGATGLTGQIGAWVAAHSISPYVGITLISLFLIFLGCFMDSLGVMVLSLPICFPVITNLGFDPIWFGVIVIVLLEIGLITPPVGLTVYVVKGIVGDCTLEDVFWGCGWFFVMMILVLILLIAFPQIVLWLPNMMR